MKRLLLALSVIGSLTALSASDADAFVCARGMYRAGCIGPNGAIGVRRGFYGPRVVGVRRGFYGPRPLMYRGFRRW
jgi:hypothetical protein